VPDCAEVLGRSIHATESLLTRARTAFREAYPDLPPASKGGDDA
jgi:RNA polymerase sigma-70 factor (ECF subfamily)